MTSVCFNYVLIPSDIRTLICFSRDSPCIAQVCLYSRFSCPFFPNAGLIGDAAHSDLWLTLGTVILTYTEYKLDLIIASTSDLTFKLIIQFDIIYFKN